ncbi:MAG: hypothetical protein U1F18_13690 [Steroidobacteraceae bacterium]
MIRVEVRWTAVAAAWLLAAGGVDVSRAQSAPAPAPAPALGAATAPRSWGLGFAINPPRPSVRVAVQGIDRWSRRAEYAALHEAVPWRELLAGTAPQAIIARDKVKLFEYLRGKGLRIYFMADATDGLSRAEEAPQLRAAGRSLAEPAVQRLYRDYVLAVARELRPEIIGLAAETNLVRTAAPARVYAAVVQVANDTAAALRAAGSPAILLASVQVESAWGVLGNGGRTGPGTGYAGIERDFADFPFAQWLGLSSYPYFAFSQPEDIPDDYYRRLLGGRERPVMVVEGGWSSTAVGPVRSSPQLQARYFARQARLLDDIGARGLLQLLFADLDLRAFPKPQPVLLPLFAGIGVVDSRFGAKPALAAWDALHARPYAPR